MKMFLNYMFIPLTMCHSFRCSNYGLMLCCQYAIMMLMNLGSADVAQSRCLSSSDLRLIPVRADQCQPST